MAYNRAKRAQLGTKVRKPGRRVLLNYVALSAMRQGIAEGLDGFAAAVLDRARPNVPDEPPLGRGLVNTGGWATYIDGRKVGGPSSANLGRRHPQKAPRQGIALFVGYDFPAHFLELGTIKMAARPFLAPAWHATEPELTGFIRPAVEKALKAAPDNA